MYSVIIEAGSFRIYTGFELADVALDPLPPQLRSQIIANVSLSDQSQRVSTQVIRSSEGSSSRECARNEETETTRGEFFNRYLRMSTS